MKRLEMYTTLFSEDTVKTQTYRTSLVPDVHQVESPCINLYPELHYQTIQGFGAALTEAAGFAISSLSAPKQEEVVNAFFGKEGLGYEYARIHMDSCDFCLGNYCAISEERDLIANPQAKEDFSDFDLSRDERYCQKLLRMVQDKLGGELPLLLSPWSPPAFMKDTGARNGGGHLRTDCYAA